MDIVLSVLKFFLPSAPIELLERGVRAIRVISDAFVLDEVRREAEIALVISELRAGKTPSILEEAIS